MADLRTRYLGLDLRSPLVASSSPLTGTLDGLLRLEAAVELNIYYVSSRPGRSGSEVEWHYLDVVRAVRRAIGIPLAVKLSPYFSSLANMAGQLAEAGAGGLVLFNRFYQPDLDIETMEVAPWPELSSSTELRLPLRWIAILHRCGVSLAASTGVHTATDVLKVLLAGADVAMMTSALLRHGPDHGEAQARWLGGGRGRHPRLLDRRHVGLAPVRRAAGGEVGLRRAGQARWASDPGRRAGADPGG